MSVQMAPILEETRLTLMPGRPRTFTFSTADYLPAAPKDLRFRLRLCGDSGVHPSWMWEGGFPLLYRDIDDALCTESRSGAYSLRLAEEDGGDFPRSVYFKLPCPPRCTAQFAAQPSDGGRWRFGLWLKGKEFTAPDGEAFVRIERFLKKPGRDPRDLNDPADEELRLPLPQGTFGWRELSCTLPVDEATACLLFTITVRRTTGELLLDTPTFCNSAGQTVLPPFMPANRHHESLNWFGENLSRKEWTDLAVTLNGVRLPRVSLFQRCHLRSENEVPLPSGLLRAGGNTLTLENVNTGVAPLPYRLQALQLLYEHRRAVEVEALPQLVRQNSDFPVLLSVREAGTVLSLSSDSPEVTPVVAETTIEEPGLHAVYFHAGRNDAGITLRVTAGNCSVTAGVERIVVKGEDGVLVGTGDAVYIPQEPDAMQDFIVWYLSNHLGNYITFRPVYRWCGTREVNEALWRRVAALCNELQLAYCHMIDGRELPGINANPTREMLAGEYFVGNQGHERDGAFCYWGAPRFRNDANELFYRELRNRILRHPDWGYSNRLIYSDHGIFTYIDTDGCTDMKEARDQFVACARESLRGVDRHTGPAVYFREFFEAGLPIGGAETMYGPNEVLLSALRGATRAYQRDYFISHLALQWYSTPHDTPANCRRYQLALFVSYLQGVRQINTEEGLWHMEENFAKYDRFSDCCQSHALIEQRFVKFVQCHTRRGAPVTPVALLHGRYDGWSCFGRGSAWGKTGAQWAFSAPEESWDLLRVFYPDSVLDELYRHPCPDEPQGYYTRTPYGAVDILPVEAPPELLARYGALAFLGYHAAQPQDVGKLTEYVRRGGTLLLSWPHLFTQTNRAKVLAGDSGLVSQQERLTGVRLDGFLPAADGLTPGNVVLGPDCEVLLERGGVPLVIRHALGEGEVLLVNAREYPAAPAVRPVYEELLRRLGQREAEAQRARGWMDPVGPVEFTAYDDGGARTIYAVNIDWWGKTSFPAKARLLLGDRAYETPLLRGVIHTFTICGDFAVWTADDETEVLSLSRRELRIQSAGEAEFYLVGEFRGVRIPGLEVRAIIDTLWLVRGPLQGICRVRLELD